ncbi:hypothetical protein [Hydrococcus rivularis]|uniref:hypothetical protein n=1 Tax=Hydrococcus rivularis TaxID=1616834 RepID=UPI0009F90235|nr:hypothetical protein [Hydrococcus rivularis]
MVEDFLFNGQTGEIAAFVLEGDLAAFFSGRAVLFPQDIEGIQAEAIVLKDGAEKRLQSESEGLKGFLSAKKSQVRRLVKCLSDRLYALVSSDDRPEVVRIKIKIVSEELAISGRYDKNALAEATEFVQQHWASIEYDLNRPKQWAKWAVEKAWQQITSK